MPTGNGGGGGGGNGGDSDDSDVQVLGEAPRRAAVTPTPEFQMRRPTGKPVNPSTATTFSPDVVQGLIDSALADEKEAGKDAKQIKLSPSAMQASGEVLKTFVQEATRRSIALSEEEGAKLSPAHLARILPGLLLDF